MIWLAGLGLFAVAAVGIWFTVTRTDYLPRLAMMLVRQALPVILKRKSPEQERLWREAIRRGEEWDHIRNRAKEKR
jgi:hypothetical protein